MFGELPVAVASDPGRRAAANRPKDVNRIQVVIFAAPTAQVSRQPPAMVSALSDVVDAGWRVPGEKEIALAVTVVGEEIAQLVEVEIIRIAESVCDHLTLPAIGGQAEQGTALHLSNGRMGQGYVLGSEAAVIAANDVP